MGEQNATLAVDDPRAEPGAEARRPGPGPARRVWSLRAAACLDASTGQYRRVHECDAGGVLESIMASADDVEGILADLVGRPLDEHAPALIVRSARRLGSGEFADVEERQLRQLVEAGGVVLGVVFDLDQERWMWDLGIE